eukprot:9199522-Heterocapsa_arctica.AAC.1
MEPTSPADLPFDALAPKSEPSSPPPTRRMRCVAAATSAKRKFWRSLTRKENKKQVRTDAARAAFEGHRVEQRRAAERRRLAV